jgi:hypothetical protein
MPQPLAPCMFHRMSIKHLSSLFPLTGLYEFSSLSLESKQEPPPPPPPIIFLFLFNRWHHIESLLNGGITITVNFWYKVNISEVLLFLLLLICTHRQT